MVDNTNIITRWPPRVAGHDERHRETGCPLARERPTCYYISPAPGDLGNGNGGSSDKEREQQKREKARRFSSARISRSAMPCNADINHPSADRKPNREPIGRN